MNLRDLSIIKTLGVGGFGRVELVRKVTLLLRVQTAFNTFLCDSMICGGIFQKYRSLYARVVLHDFVELECIKMQIV